MKDEKNFFTSDDLYNTMEVPAVEKSRPSGSERVEDPWRLNSDGQPDEVLEFISKKLAEKEKERQQARESARQFEVEMPEFASKKDSTMVLGGVANNDDTIMIPEVSPSEDTVLIPEIKPTDNRVVEQVEPEPVKPAVTDDTIVMKRTPTVGVGQRIVSNETTAVVKKVEPEKKDNFPPENADDEMFDVLYPTFGEEFADDDEFTEKKNDPDATQLIETVEPAKKPSDEKKVVVRLDGPEDKIERAPAPKGRLWPPVVISSLVLIVACFVTLALGVLPVLVQNGFAKGLTQIITPVLTAGQPAAKTNVLLVGVDKDGYRTDTMMVATYNVDTKQITILQLPRDTYVPNNGRRDKKLNSAYFTGIDQLKKEVNMAYGMEIHKYVEVNIDAFKMLIDAIGGVEIDVPINMIYDDPVQDLHIYLLKGTQVLDGEKAEQFVRFRKNNDGTGYPRGDLQRMEAQQDFITATFKQIVSGDGLKNINKLIKIALENVNTDLSFNEIYDYCSAMLTSEQEMQFMEAPGYARMISGGSYFIVEYDKAVEIAKSCFYATDEEIANMNRVSVKADSAPAAPAPKPAAPADTPATTAPADPAPNAPSAEGTTPATAPAEESPASQTPTEPAAATPVPETTEPMPEEPTPAPLPDPVPAPVPESVPTPAPAPEAGAMSR